MKQITLTRQNRKTDQSCAQVGSEAKCLLPTGCNQNNSSQQITWMDVAGLSWVFLGDEDYLGDYA